MENDMALNTEVFEKTDADIQKTLIRLLASLEAENVRLKSALKVAYQISRRQFIGEKILPHEWDKEIGKVTGTIFDTVWK